MFKVVSDKLNLVGVRNVSLSRKLCAKIKQNISEDSSADVLMEHLWACYLVAKFVYGTGHRNMVGVYGPSFS
jgi:hypothetical protein